MRKMTRLALAAATAAWTAGSAVAGTVLLNEGFNNGVPAGWVNYNDSQYRSGPAWFQGYDSPAPFFPAQSGAATSYVASSAFVGAQTPTGDPAGEVYAYLQTPTVALSSNTVLSFWTRTVANNSWGDYLYVGMFVNGVDTGLLEVNPTIAPGGYPEDWTQFTVDIASQGAGAQGVLYFIYYLPDASQMGNYIGLDTVSLQVPEPAGWLALGGCLLAAGVATSRRRRA